MTISNYHYFLELSEIIKKSARFEFFAYLGLRYNEIGPQVNKPNTGASHSYQAFALPESASDFASGYKVLTFYIDPESLIERSFVLRRTGWKNITILYQRPLIAKKISSMRQHLQAGKGVFVNNIIATVPSKTTFSITENNIIKQLNPNDLNKMGIVTMTLPDEFNSICLIDGQHRVFSYHEGNDKLEGDIKNIRGLQNLLVTAVYYPDGVTDEQKAVFEARLFLDINNTQTGAKKDLIQALKTIIDRFSVEAIALKVLHELNDLSALKNKIAVHPHEDGEKLPPTTIVSYGLKPIVKLSGSDSAYFLWKDQNKAQLLLGTDTALLNDYIKFTAEEINTFISSFKTVIKTEMGGGNVDKHVTIMIINGLISCLRLLILNKKAQGRAYYVLRFKGIGSFVFSDFTGSRWNALGVEIYNKHFKAS